MTNVHFTAWVMMILNHSPKLEGLPSDRILIEPSYGFLDLPDELIAKIFLDFWDSQPEMWLITSRRPPLLLSYLNRRIRSILQDQAWINFFCLKYISREPSVSLFAEIPLKNLVQHLNARYAKFYLKKYGVAHPLAVMTGKRSLSLKERETLVQLLHNFDLTFSFLFSHFGVLSSHLIEPGCLLAGMRLHTFSGEIKQLLDCYLGHPVAGDLSDDDHCLALLDACLLSGSYSQLSIFRQASSVFERHYLGQMGAESGYAAFDVFTRRIINRYFPEHSLVGARESNRLSTFIGGLVNYIHFWKCVSLDYDRSLLEKRLILSLYNFEIEKSETRLYIHLANFVYLFYEYFLGIVSAETLISIFKQSDFRNEIFYLQLLLRSLFSFDLFSFFLRHRVFSELMYSFVTLSTESPVMFVLPRLVEVLDGFNKNRLDKRKIGYKAEYLEALIVLSMIRNANAFSKFDDAKRISDELNQSTLISIPNVVVDWLQHFKRNKSFAEFLLSLHAKPLKALYHLCFSKTDRQLASLKAEMSKILARQFDDFVQRHDASFFSDLLGSIYLIDFSYQFIGNFLSEERGLLNSNHAFSTLFYSNFQKYLDMQTPIMRLYFLWRCQSIWKRLNLLRHLNFSDLSGSDLYRMRRFDEEIVRVLLTQPHAMEKFLLVCNGNQFFDIFQRLGEPRFYSDIYEIVKAIFSCFSNRDFPLERMYSLLPLILGSRSFSYYLEVTEFNNIQHDRFSHLDRVKDALVRLLDPRGDQQQACPVQLSLKDRLRLSLLFPDRANDFIFYQDLCLEGLIWERLFTMQQEFRLYRNAILLQKKVLLRALGKLSDAAGLQVLEFLLSEPGWPSNMQTREQVIEILLSVIQGFDKRRAALVMGSMYLFMKHDLFIHLVEYLRKNNKEDFFSYSFDVCSHITVSDLRYSEGLFSLWFALVLKLYEAWNREKGRFIFVKMLEYFIGQQLDMPINRAFLQLIAFPELFKLFLARVPCQFRMNRKDWTALISKHPEKFNELIACLDVMSVLSHHFPDFVQEQEGSTYSHHSFSILACLPFRLNVNQVHALVLANSDLASAIKVRIETSLRGRPRFSFSYLKLLAEYLCHHQVYLEQPKLWQDLFLSLKRWFENQTTKGCFFNKKPTWLDDILSHLGAYRSLYPSASNGITLNLQQCFFWCPPAERDPFCLEVPPRSLSRFKLNGPASLVY